MAIGSVCGSFGATTKSVPRGIQSENSNKHVGCVQGCTRAASLLRVSTCNSFCCIKHKTRGARKRGAQSTGKRAQRSSAPQLCHALWNTAISKAQWDPFHSTAHAGSQRAQRAEANVDTKEEEVRPRLNQGYGRSIQRCANNA